VRWRRRSNGLGHVDGERFYSRVANYCRRHEMLNKTIKIRKMIMSMYHNIFYYIYP
jgi:hypothetical protein